jgi:hypothetical protein
VKKKGFASQAMQYFGFVGMHALAEPGSKYGDI